MTTVHTSQIPFPSNVGGAILEDDAKRILKNKPGTQIPIRPIRALLIRQLLESRVLDF